MSCRDAKVGDIVIANRLANAHHIFTREGWIGIIKDITSLGEVVAEGKYPNEVNKKTYTIDLDYFDFFPLTSAQKLSKKLGFETEDII